MRLKGSVGSQSGTLARSRGPCWDLSVLLGPKTRFQASAKMDSREPLPRGAKVVVGPPRAFRPRGPHNHQRGGGRTPSAPSLGYVLAPCRTVRSLDSVMKLRTTRHSTKCIGPEKQRWSELSSCRSPLRLQLQQLTRRGPLSPPVMHRPD